MIDIEPIISIKANAIFDNDEFVNYEVIETHFGASTLDDHTVQSFFIDKAAMKQHIKDLIRSI